jgi:hypothetical protein
MVHNNVFNYEVSNMFKKIEKIESIQLQLVIENSETKEQIKNPLVVKESKDQPISEEERIEAKGQQILKAEGISGNLVASLGFIDLKPNDVHKEEFLDLSQERESMKFRKLHFISDNVDIKEGIDKSTKEQEFMKKVSHTNGLYCDADEVFDENLERGEFLGRVKKIWVCPLTRTEWSGGILISFKSVWLFQNQNQTQYELQQFFLLKHRWRWKFIEGWKLALEMK